MNKNLKIAIIGAGAAGITAAEELKNRGYENITIFEKSAQAGGKCCSIEYKGRFYELGAGIITSGYETILKLVKKHQVEIKLVDNFSRTTFYWDDELQQKISQKNPIFENISLFFETLFRYRRLIHRYQKITEPGLQHVPSELTIPFSQWAIQQKIPHLAQMFSYFFSGFGYGYFDKIPAAYVLKYYSWVTIQAFIRKKVYYLPNGIQHLWTKIAKQHQVIYNASITKVERNKSIKITYQIEKNDEIKEQVFDKLIITSPLDETPKYLDVSAEETSLFAKILYYDYRTYAFALKGFPSVGGYLPKNFTASREGHPVFWHQPYLDSNFFAFYTLDDGKRSNEEGVKIIEKTVQKLGGKIETIQSIRHWKYFPHVTPQDLKNGYFDKLEALQGQKNTYFAGEIMNFSTVELTAEYATNLIERFF